MKPIIAVGTPIHVSTTGPVYLLSPDAAQLRHQHHRHQHQRAWLSRKLQTLLLGVLAAMSLAVLLHPIGPVPGAPPHVPLAHRRSMAGGGSGSAATLVQQQSNVAQRQRQQQQQQQQQRYNRWQQEAAMAPPAPPDFPLHICCVGKHCLTGDKRRYAVVTYVRSQQQLEQAKALASSLWQTNPGLDLAVMLMRGELSPELSAAVLGLNATVFYVEPLLASSRGRGWGWLKGPDPPTWLQLRAFGLTQYDAVILAEPGRVFKGDVSPLLRLPTDFATLLPGRQPEAQGSGSTPANSSSSGSAGPPREVHTEALAARALFLRPCAPAEAHMAAMVGGAAAGGAASGSGTSSGGGGESTSAMPAGLASEADFLAWYSSPETLDVRLPFEVYVINLDAAPDRLAAFRHGYAASDLGGKAAVRWPAVDGRSLDLGQIVSGKAMEEIEAAQALGYRTKHYQLTRGSVGCYMSHLQLFKAVLAQAHEHALVFEDDAVIQPGALGRLAAARPFPPDWDVMLLGYYCWRCSPLLSDRRFIWVEGFFGTHAYLISRRAVRKMFAYPHLMPVEQQIDALMSEMAQERLLNVYALNEHPMLVEQNNKDFATSVQIPVKRGLWNDPYSRER